MKIKGFTLLELLLSLSILSVSFLAFSACLETQKRQNYNIQLYKSFYPFLEAFQWFFHSRIHDEPKGTTWLAYKNEEGERKFIKQIPGNEIKYSFKVEVQFKDPFYEVIFFDKTTRVLAKFYWKK